MSSPSGAPFVADSGGALASFVEDGVTLALLCFSLGLMGNGLITHSLYLENGEVRNLMAKEGGGAGSGRRRAFAFVSCCPGRCGPGCIVRDVLENGEGGDGRGTAAAAADAGGGDAPRLACGRAGCSFLNSPPGLLGSAERPCH